MRLYLVRHGETDWNKARKIQGQVDIPLNEFGRHLARETHKGVKDVRFDICFSSPLSRAKETASLILEGRDVKIIDDNRIMEMNFGDYDGGCCSKEGWNLPEDFAKFFDDPANYKRPPHGEDFYDLQKRVGEFLEELIHDEKYKESHILISTHGAALAAMLNYIRKNPMEKFWGIGVHKNCAITEILVEDETPKILSENVVYYKDEVAAW